MLSISKGSVVGKAALHNGPRSQRRTKSISVYIIIYFVTSQFMFLNIIIVIILRLRQRYIVEHL